MVILLNSVLNDIPVYFSFPKMPLKAWKSLVKIQRIFLWGGVKGDSKICWAKWSNVCKSKMNGGLGVRDLCFLNLFLIDKWRERLLTGALIYGLILFLFVMVLLLSLLCPRAGL